MSASLTLRRNLKYCGLQALYWMLGCSVIPFSSMYLLNFGYSNVQIGIVLAVGYITGMLFQPLTASLADKNIQHPASLFVIFLCCLHILIIIGLFFCHSKSILLAVLYALFIALEICIQPHINSFAIYIEQTGTPIRFGMARGCGSLSWGLTSLLLTFLIKTFGNLSMLVVSIITNFLLILLLFSMQDIYRTESPKNMSIQDGSSYRFLYTIPFFMYFLLGISLIHFGFSFIDNYPYQIVTSIGGNSIQMGRLVSFVALIEIPAMFSFEFLYRKFGSRKLIIFSTLFFILKNTLIYTSHSIPALYFANFFHLFSYAILVPVSVRFCGEVNDPINITKAQALLTMMMTIGNILSSVSGGWLIDTISVKGMLAMGGIATIIGAMLVLLSLCLQKN